MSRPSGIWPRKTKSGVTYYTKINGQQIRLSSDEDEAREKFALLTKTDLPGDVSRAEEICDEFLEHTGQNKTKKTYRIYSRSLHGSSNKTA